MQWYKDKTFNQKASIWIIAISIISGIVIPLWPKGQNVEKDSVLSCESINASMQVNIDFKTKRHQCKDIYVGKDNIQVTFENGNNSIGDYVVINLISPISGVIGTTTFRTGSNTGPIIWNGGIDPGVSVVNGLTDRFIFEATATSTSFISADLIGTK